MADDRVNPGLGVICLIWWAIFRPANSAMWTVKTASGTFTIRCDPTKTYEPFESYAPIDAGPWIVTVQGPHVTELGYHSPEGFALYDDAMARVRTIQRELAARSAEPA